MSRLALASAVFLSVGFPPALMLFAAPQPADGPVIILHAPWVDGADLVRAAGGWAVGPLQAAMGTFAVSDNMETFRAGVRAAGAWAVLDGAALAGLCGLPLDADPVGWGMN